jgi:hypothetical protein
MELPYSSLNPQQREQVHARFRDDLFSEDSSRFLYQFSPRGLFRRPLVLQNRSATRARRNPEIRIIETGAPHLSPQLMDICINAYFTHVQKGTSA